MVKPKSEYTPTEERIMKVLSDGLPHTPDELQACLYDDAGEVKNIHPHLTLLRRKLKTKGMTVCHEKTGRKREDGMYRLIRLMASPYDGYT